ncbi:hypothetical protein [Acinetobacter sp. WCHAc010034]|uniref:hypothetical protein n=1 Tax=Acinetobacter sp. WCHAc010034 TaxID=1879049 RepID=UPI0013C3486C|nr:hypothetical protein [Acinetobacter sp. WCHAc010034]MBL8321490.1 hypothetical protein [Acinetobacter sp.]
MFNKLISTLKVKAPVQASSHAALAAAKMEQAVSRLAASKKIALFQTDYLE